MFGVAVACSILLAGCQSNTANPQSDIPSSNDNSTVTTTSTPTTPAAASQQAVAAKPVSINSKTVTWKNKTYTFVHNCAGQQKQGALLGDAKTPVAYCLGTSTLSIVDPNQKSSDLYKITATDPSKTPVLLDAQLIPGSMNGAVLVSFSPEACTTTGKCSAGMPSNYVTMAVDLNNTSFSYSSIHNYPASGTPVWDTYGIKALFIPQTCGGAGCDVAPLIGYSLITDTLNNKLTKETGAGVSGQSSGPVSDVNSKKLAVWKSASWTSDTQFKAVLTGADGTDKTITGTF